MPVCKCIAEKTTMIVSFVERRGISASCALQSRVWRDRVGISSVGVSRMKRSSAPMPRIAHDCMCEKGAPSVVQRLSLDERWRWSRPRVVRRTCPSRRLLRSRHKRLQQQHSFRPNKRACNPVRIARDLNSLSELRFDGLLHVPIAGIRILISPSPTAPYSSPPTPLTPSTPFSPLPEHAS